MKKALEWEYSTDFDVSSAEIDANYNKLKELADKYKKRGLTAYVKPPGGTLEEQLQRFQNDIKR